MTDTIFQDWEANANNPKGRFVLSFFRLCQVIRRQPEPVWVFGIPVLALYVLLVHWVMGIELDYQTAVGPGLRLYHGVGLVVHQRSVIGANCTLRHGVTLGWRRENEGCPILEDGVELGAGAIILGPVRVGKNAVIGAASLVLNDVEAGSRVGGNPARAIRRRDA